MAFNNPDSDVIFEVKSPDEPNTSEPPMQREGNIEQPSQSGDAMIDRGEKETYGDKDKQDLTSGLAESPQTGTVETENVQSLISEIRISDTEKIEVPKKTCVSTDVEKDTVKHEKPKSEQSAAAAQVYRLKWIEWHSKRTPIVTQNENGPCPLIAIANILLLRGKIQLRTSVEYITAEELMEYIGDTIMDSIPKDLQAGTMLNYEQNMHDAIAILPRLHTGLDVNVKFTGVQHFEYTPECIIFDLLNIPLYHGWLVDPQCRETVHALGNLGYNQLVERIIVNKCSSDSDLVTEALIAEQFLERTASQLTYHGLCELNSAMKQEELAVLFRNNHFSTILKKKHELFQLVTDQGFLHEPRVVWETLCNIEGDGQFVDSQFATVPPKATDCFMTEPALTEEQQINQDFLVALSLQEEQKKQQDHDQAWQDYRQNIPGMPDLTDEELARRLQDERQPLQSPQIPVPARAPSPSASTTSHLIPSPASERGRKSVCNLI